MQVVVPPLSDADSLQVVCSSQSGEFRKRRRANLQHACRKGRLDEVVRHFENNVVTESNDPASNPDETALHYACMYGRLDIVKYLVENVRANVELTVHKKGTPLHEACRYGKLEVVKYLIERASANVDAVIDDCGDGILHTACGTSTSNVSLEVVQYLLNKVSNVNARSSHGWTALHCASSRGRWEVVHCLVEGQVRAKRRNGFR
jgi:ankyrin repeat protein